MRGAAGWDGDRYVLFNGAGGQGLAWASVWDSRVEASEFFDILDRLIRKRYDVTAASAPGSVSRSYSASGRSLQITTQEVGGRPVVTYVDVPVGSTSVLDVSKLELKQ